MLDARCVPIPTSGHVAGNAGANRRTPISSTPAWRAFVVLTEVNSCARHPPTGSPSRRRLRMLSSGIAAEWGIYVRFLDNGDESHRRRRRMDT